MSTHAFRRIAMAASAALVLVIAALIAGGPALAKGNANPGVVPNNGPRYGQLSAEWWQWALSYPAAEVPFRNPGGVVDLSDGQSGNVWFLAGTSGLAAVTRTGEVPTGTSLFLPLANYINDFPCPDPTFVPGPNETLEEFLQRTGNDAVPPLTDLFAEIDGVPLTDLSAYRVTSSMFMFTADPSPPNSDPCITGTSQFGVSVGYWLLLPPMPPGVHTLHFGATDWGQDITYIITVTPGR